MRKNDEIHSFPIYQDSEIFVNDELIQKFLIYDEKVRHDEDVDTDEEVRNLGIRQCSRSFMQTRDTLSIVKPNIPASLGRLNKLIKNTSIDQRVANPDEYDRLGKKHLGHPRP